MTSRRLAWLMAGAVAITSAAPAMAQYETQSDSAYQQQLQTYQQQRSSYEARRADYDSRQAQYDADRAAYERARDDYDRRYGRGAYDRRYPSEASRWRTPAYPTSNDYYAEQRQFEADRAAYQRARDRYDARNGRGAYDRRYPDEARRFDTRGYDQADAADYDAQRRQWESDRAAYERARDDYDRRYGRGSYDRRYPDAGDRYETDPYAGSAPPPVYSDNTRLSGGSYSDPCRDDAKRNATAGGVIGALAGAVIGSNVAARNAKTEGAVLGAVVGAGAGAAIGNSAAKARCDTRGQYWSYDDTVPYRESADYRDRAGGYSEWNRYNERKCRLVQAPTEYQGRTESRYVRVCPDSDGRYRVDG